MFGLVVMIFIWSVGWLCGWWLDGWMDGLLVGWLVGWLDGWLVIIIYREKFLLQSVLQKLIHGTPRFCRTQFGNRCISALNLMNFASNIPFLPLNFLESHSSVNEQSQ
jgi:organic anion transporter 5A